MSASWSICVAGSRCWRRGPKSVSKICRAELAADSEATAEVDWAKALASWADRQAMVGKRPLLTEAQPEFERVLIRAALKRTQGHRQDAAKLLGWGRNTLTRKLKELGMNTAE